MAYDTRLQNSETGEWALTTPTVQVRPDIQQSSDFMHYLSYTRSNGLPAPSRADSGSLGAYRYAMDTLTRPAWNAWASQNQGFYRDQGFGAGVIREPGLVFKRDDMRDLAAMGRFVWGGVKGTINGLAAVPQMVPAWQAYLWSTGSDVWQPFEINGSVEAGEFSFGIAGLFTGGGALAAARSVRLTSEVLTAERTVPSLASRAESVPHNFGANSAASGVRLNSQLIAEEVSAGHAYAKHVIERGEFADLGISTKHQFSTS